MPQRTRTILATVGLTLTGVFLAGSHAEAQSLSSCGDIHVEAEARCEVVPPGASCEAQCTPIAVEAACAAQLTAQCEGECRASAELECNVDLTSCRASCEGRCNIDPGKFDCSANCQASCNLDCSGRCEASANRAECEASCEANCSGQCDASCDIERPSIDCMAECEASCDGSCRADASAKCQIDCQADFYADCKVDVQGGCEVDCQTMEGALFCGGRYVDHGDNLKECVDALRARFNARVEWEAEGESSCENGTCMASGRASAKCSTLPGSPAATSMLSALGLSLVALFLRSRRVRARAVGRSGR